MEEYENEKEQDPAYGTGSEQPRAQGADSEQPPAYGASSQPPPPAQVTGSQPPPAPVAGSQQTDAHWAGGYQPSQPTGYGSGGPQPPGYGSGGPQPPGYGSGGPQPTGYGSGDPQPPGYPSGAEQSPSYAAGPQQQTQAYATGSQQPPPYGPWQSSGGSWPPPPGSSYGSWGTPPSPPRRSGRRALAFAVVAVLGVGVGAAAAFGITHGSQPTSSPGASAVPTPGSQRAPLQNTGTSKINTQAIATEVSPSVADITSKIKYQNETAEGTGIVISSSGLVLTNNHVVDGASQVTAQIDGAGRTYTARVLGTDKTDDVALLQLEGASGLKPASIGDSSKVALGNPVVALGNEGGQGGTPTVHTGSITNLNRTITAGDQGSSNTETLHGMLQTDAGIAAGDSGGPLVNASGQVIGMDTAASSSSFGQTQSIGFAIPINNALSIARQIAAGHGSSTIQIGPPAFLGVQVCNVSDAQQCLSSGFGVGGGGATAAPVSSGALVASVLPGTPAQSAGLAAGDVITRLNGSSVTSANDLTKAMQSHRPGDSVSVTWVDTSGQQHTATVTLTTGPAS
jgi:S1-C subfamily serine protease